MALVAAGDYHHHLALNTFQSAGGTPPPPGHTGLHHVAAPLPRPARTGARRQRLLDRGHPLDSAEDHGGTVSVYLRDPDGNGIELYYDRPRETWFDPQGRRSSRPTPSTRATCSPTSPLPRRRKPSLTGRSAGRSRPTACAWPLATIPSVSASSVSTQRR